MVPGGEAMHKREELTAIPMVTIRQMGKLIGKRFRPDKVILFGSYARGEGGVNSDVDLPAILRSFSQMVGWGAAGSITCTYTSAPSVRFAGSSNAIRPSLMCPR